jgi:predicted DNA-binding transcriptional regulator YafY
MRNDLFRVVGENVAVSPAARLLRLLALLQDRRDWTGPQLAERLGVTSRTVRADVERLRELGYPVDAQAGVGGGYRLGAGTALPPLIVDDDEAVAIAVGLRTAAGGTVAGIEEASVRALAKLDQVLPSRLRRRVHALHGYVVALGAGGPAVDADLLVTISSACRDRERLRLTYRTHAGDTIRRIVEPHQLVHLGRFWYLVAWDLHRDAWRTFRLDRFDGVPGVDRRFTPRPPPAGGFAAHVARGRTSARGGHQAEVILHGPLAELAQRVPPTSGTLEALDDERCLLRVGGDWLGAIAVHIALLEVDFEVVTPPALASQVARLAERFGRAARSYDQLPMEPGTGRA